MGDAPVVPPDPPWSILASALELGRKQEAAQKKTNTINVLKICLSYNIKELIGIKSGVWGLAGLK